MGSTNHYRIGVIALLVSVLALTACGNGGGGGGGSDSASRGRIEGTVTNALTAGSLGGATVAIDPAVDGSPVTSAANGTYSFKAPKGDYRLRVTHPDYDASEVDVTVKNGKRHLRNLALMPEEPVILNPGGTVTIAPGQSAQLAAGITILDGSSIQSILWEQSNSVDVALTGSTTATPTVTLPSLATYRDYLFHVLAEPPLTEEQLPENIELPEEWPGGLQDRFGVQALNPWVLEHVSHVTLKLTVTTSSGTFEEEVDVVASLPWRVNPGLNNVPMTAPVLMHGKEQGSYAWAVDGPDGSSAAFDDASLQNPTFTPDMGGTYVISEAVSGMAMELFAGRWTGTIDGQDGDGRPLSPSCTVCHDGGIAPDKFTEWAKSGHAEILTNNLNTSTHYGTGCFSCHSVGFDTASSNAGFDDSADYGAFLGAGLLNNPGDNWTTMLAQFPASARKANIQCESCHGPQDSPAHVRGAPRMSISSDVCATCHGEPLRHARFQQWQLSPHSNYELAIDEHDSGSCSRCHTGNGFLAWLPYLLADSAESEVNVTWTADSTHPQTCVTCHEPHNPGSTSGEPTNATVRIAGDTPLLLAGFRATDVGRGAICMTCHNSRRGLRNDVAFPVADSREAHPGAQADILMGQNVYFVPVGDRSPHADVDDACVSCHMEKTPPPALLAYKGGGTNHTFIASRESCQECHGEAFDENALATLVEGKLHDVQENIENAILGEIKAHVADGSDVYLKSGSRTLAVVDKTNVDTLTGRPAEDGGMLGGSRGRQVVTVKLDGATYSNVRIDSIKIGSSGGTSLIDSNLDTGGTLTDKTGQIIAKSGWNWFLFHNDGSEGAHNPGFTLDVLNATLEKLGAVLDLHADD